eukprot:GFKZ01015909.1.p1 GENE.GFKZ01015909.1~~GFKZ01015909.1.p1  ORF type:complete len:855 (+),score=82.33 GFKZ01015909.1:235-2565(+)
MPPLRLALIDNLDSYTHNLSHLLAQSNHNYLPTVIPSHRHATLSSLLSKHPPFDAYILSPGPGHPSNTTDFSPLQHEILASALPVLAVCLGHQALCAHFGATVSHAPAGPVHGHVTPVHLTPHAKHCPLMSAMPPSFYVVRYHSLAVVGPLSGGLMPTAWAVDGASPGVPVLMAVSHSQRPLFGVQFHPESVGTALGAKLAGNFVDFVTRFRGLRSPEFPIAAPTRGVRRGVRRLKCVVRSVRDVPVGGEVLFKGLYGRCVGGFWLDSSSAVRLGSSVSRCSSPDLGETREGREDGNKGRYSIMGGCDGPLAEVLTYRVGDGRVLVRDSEGRLRAEEGVDAFGYLEQQLRERYVPPHPDLPIEMNGGYVGYFGYELKADTEGVVQNRHRADLPDAWFVFADRVVVVDHEEGCVFLVGIFQQADPHGEAACERWFDVVDKAIRRLSACAGAHVLDRTLGQKRVRGARLAGAERALEFVPEQSRRAYLEDIRECLREIRDGESYEVCLTNRLRTVLPAGCEVDALDIYSALRQVNPAPYAAFLRVDKQVAVCCSSPERYMRISSSGVVESKPIKGTLPRGRSLEEDERLRHKLQTSVKDRSENLMIVDLVRNDLSRTCAVGSVQVPRLMDVESYATVHQLVSTVTGVLCKRGDAVNCIRAAYPMGSMTGAPKVRTMEIIDRLERSSRGIYSGSIGYLGLCGAADLNVVIRTAIVRGRHVEIGVGGAIVALSSPEEEYEEVILKGKAIMKALAGEVGANGRFVVVDGDSKEEQGMRRQR